MTLKSHPFAMPPELETADAASDGSGVQVPDSALAPAAGLPGRSETGAAGVTQAAAEDRGGTGDDFATPAPLPVLEGYQIVARLGAGGMGTVWRAWQLSTRREVALKLLKFGGMASERAKRRFDREVEVTSRLQHPHLARVYDSGIHQGVYFYAMELIEGVPFDTFVRQQKLDRRQVLGLMVVICRAMQHAHQRGVIHRDLKPSNILVDAAGEPHVVDFGLGKSIEATGTGTGGAAAGDSGAHLVDTLGDVPSQPRLLTVDGEWAGTPLYMSPEQAAGKVDQLDTRTDVYSLGVMLYQLLTGRFPHDPTGGSVKVLQRLVDEEVLRPRSVSAEIDVELDALLLKALSRNPDDRYASAGALADDIENYLHGEPLSARAPTALYLMRKKLRKHRLPLGLAAAVVIGMLSLGIYGSVRVARERDVATALAKDEAASRAAAEVQLSDSLAAWGEMLAAAGRWPEAGEKFAESRRLAHANGLTPVAADLGLLDVLEHAPNAVAEFAGSAGAGAANAPGDVAFAADGTRLAWTDSAGAAHVQPLPGGRLESSPQPADAAAVGPVRLAGGAKHVVRVVVPRVTSAAVAPAPAADGEAAATRPGPPLLQWVDVATGAPRASVPLRGSTVLANRPLSADGSRVADISSPNPDDESVPHQLLVYTFAPETGEASVRVVAEGAHLAGLSALTFADGGKRLVAGGPGGRLASWDAETGKLVPLEQLTAAKGAKYAFDVSLLAAGEPGGSLAAASQAGGIAVTGSDGNAATWTVLDNGGPARPGVKDLLFSPDGRQLAALDGGGRARVWDVRTGRLTHVVDAHRGPVAAAAFSPDGAVLATTGADGRVRLWPVRQEVGGRALRAHDQAAAVTTALAISADGRLAASGHANREVELFEVATGRVLQRQTVRWPVASLGFTPDGRTLRVGTSQSSVFSLNAADGGVQSEVTQQPPRPLDGPPDKDRLNPGVNVFSPDGEKAIHVSIRGSTLWDLRGGKALRVLDPRPAEAACFAPAGGVQAGGVAAVLAVSDRVKELVAFDARGGRLKAIQVPGDAIVKSLALSPDGRRAIVGDQAGQLRAVDLLDARWEWASPAHDDAVTCLAFAPGGRAVLSGGADGVLRLTDAAAGRAVRVVGSGPAGVSAVSFSADGRRIFATVGDGRTTRVWDLSLVASYRPRAGQPANATASARPLPQGGTAPARISTALGTPPTPFDVPYPHAVPRPGTER